jgi:hypothetical protein
MNLMLLRFRVLVSRGVTIDLIIDLATSWVCLKMCFKYLPDRAVAKRVTTSRLL